jgi:hypothetical protein
MFRNSTRNSHNGIHDCRNDTRSRRNGIRIFRNDMRIVRNDTRNCRNDTLGYRNDIYMPRNARRKYRNYTHLCSNDGDFLYMDGSLLNNKNNFCRINVVQLILIQTHFIKRNALYFRKAKG